MAVLVQRNGVHKRGSPKAAMAVAVQLRGGRQGRPSRGLATYRLQCWAGMIPGRDARNFCRSLTDPPAISWDGADAVLRSSSSFRSLLSWSTAVLRCAVLAVSPFQRQLDRVLEISCGRLSFGQDGSRWLIRNTTAACAFLLLVGPVSHAGVLLGTAVALVHCSCPRLRKLVR